MVDFGEFQPFGDVGMIRPSITVLSKDTPGGEMRVFKWLTAGRPPEALSDQIEIAPLVSSGRFGEAAWEMEADAVLRLRQKLVCGRTLAEYTGGKFFYGVKTGLNEAFVIDRATRERFVKEHPPTAAILKPFVQGTHLRPFYIV